MHRKTRYLDIMEKALRAYSDDRIRHYVMQVQTEGLKEHGFPRLIANIGILLAHGRVKEYTDLFAEMMTFCCRQMLLVRAANDFSVSELSHCLAACENTGLFPQLTPLWRADLEAIDPRRCYDCIAKAPDHRVGNWAAYNAASECARQALGMAVPQDYLETQIASQVQMLDENGMYRDPHEPMLYDLATRCQFASMLHSGYNGPHRPVMEDCLRRSASLTLRMQAVTGEIPFGGRSNQFLFNEAYLAALMEYEATALYADGNVEKAAVYKRAATLATDAIFRWLAVTDGQKHVKNRFPQDDPFGCEGYAYFDKYMISLASFIYLAYLFADERVSESPCPAEVGGFTAQTSGYFHKSFAVCGGYGLEFDTAADLHYDATGLGRLQKMGAPSFLLLSSPFPAISNYTLPRPNPGPLAMGSTLTVDGNSYAVWQCETGSYTLRSLSESPREVIVEAICRFEPAYMLTEHYRITAKSVDISLQGDGALTYSLPLPEFDGSTHTVIALDKQQVTVEYDGWICRCTTNGQFTDTGLCYHNRNGRYRRIDAVRDVDLVISVCICPCDRT